MLEAQAQAAQLVRGGWLGGRVGVCVAGMKLWHASSGRGVHNVCVRGGSGVASRQLRARGMALPCHIQAQGRDGLAWPAPCALPPPCPHHATTHHPFRPPARTSFPPTRMWTAPHTCARNRPPTPRARMPPPPPPCHRHSQRGARTALTPTAGASADSEGIRTPAGRAQWISSPSP